VFGPDGGAGDVFDLAWTAVFSLMEGLAVERIVRAEDTKIDRVITLLKQLAPMAIAAK